MRPKLDTQDLRAIPSSLQNFSVFFLLCLSILICYANSFHNGFVQDDHYIIELNHDDLSFRTVIKILTSADNLADTDTNPYYRPLTRFSYLVDQYFFGLNPSGYHAVNIVLHAICAVLLYFVLLHLECGFAVSFGAALFFGVHPVNAETVNFISARNNILAAIFVLGSVLAFLQAEENKKRAGYVLSGFLFFLGILSKETALMLIPFLIFLKIYREQTFREPRRILKWDTTFILFHTVFLGIYLLLHLLVLDNSSIRLLAGLAGRLRQLVYIIPEYFSLVIAPRSLTFVRLVPTDYRAVILPLTLKWITLFAALVYVIRKRNKTTDLGLAWLVINSIPISNLVLIPSASLAERYLYLPMIGFLIIAGDVVVRLFTRKGSGTLAVLVFSSAAVILGIITFNKSFDWRDDLSVNKNIVAANPAYPRGHFDYGYESYLRGDHTTAEKEFKRALTLGPHLLQKTWIYYYLGALSVESRDLKMSERYFQNSIKADAGNSSAQYALATLFMKRDKKEAAVTAYDRFRSRPLLSDYHLLTEVDNLLFELGKPQKKMIQQPPITMSASSSSAVWRFVQRYPSGTELFYDFPHLQKNGNDIEVIMKQRLAKLDKHAYAMRIIRYPLYQMAEVRFAFNIKCRQHILKTEYMEFVDDAGNVLGKIWPDKEYPEMYEHVSVYHYLMPHTIMRSFSDKICAL